MSQAALPLAQVETAFAPSLLASRTVETGSIKVPSPRAFIVIAENFPVWLLALHRGITTSVCVVGANSAEEWFALLVGRSFDEQLVRRCVSAIGWSKFSFVSIWNDSKTSDEVVLLSGTLSFLLEEIPQWNHQTILLTTDTHWSSPKIPQGSNRIKWRKCQHSHFGGASNYKLLVGFSGSHLKITPAKIKPTLNHFLNHKLDLQLLPRKFDPVTNIHPFYRPTDLLNVSDLDRSLLLRSPRFHGRWCHRKLDPSEIASCFGLTLQQQGDDFCGSSLKHLVPVQLLDACLQPLVYETENMVQLVQSSRLVVSNPIKSNTYLPELDAILSHAWIDESKVTDKAVKSDDAEAPVHLWDARITLPIPHAEPLLSVLRQALLSYQTRCLYQEFCNYLTSTYGSNWSTAMFQARRYWKQDSEEYTGGEIAGLSPSLLLELLKDTVAGRSVLSNFAQATWWTWKGGSTLIFWRWPLPYRRIARDGMPPFITGPLPQHLRRRARPPPKIKLPLICDKVATVMSRNYLVPYSNTSAVTSFIDYFDVPKGSDDVRIVYNGTSCGLNAVTWSPRFPLPTPATAARHLNFNYCGVDIDLGEFFLNFPLPLELRSVSGVDLSPFRSHLNLKAESKVRWERCWMGLRPSPYMAVRFYYLAEEFIRGDRLQTDNPMRWDFVMLNLPGDPDYDPSLPRVFKWNKIIRNIAGDIIAFVDDLRATGMDAETAWRVARWVASKLQRLGIQDAPRKRRPPKQETGAWAGAVFSTLNGEISLTVSQEKWNKGKLLVDALKTKLEEDPTTELSYKELESTRGFLGHLAMTFETMVPFLKGFHLTLAKYLPMRDDEGWKLSQKLWSRYIINKLEGGEISNEEAEAAMNPPHFDDIEKPNMVQPSSRLKDDLGALSAMFELSEPPKVRVRSNKILAVLYGFCDASGSGFGSMISSGKGIFYRIGLWGRDSEEESSNWREFENAVESCEHEAHEGRLEGSELFLFTDNSTVEAALYKGNSTSPKLFSLIVRLRKLELEFGAKILVVHVAGTRMIAQGTDGVSRGQLKEGVSIGEDILAHIPLNESALDRSPDLKNWLESVTLDGDNRPMAEFLSPTDWFERGHDLVPPLSGPDDKGVSSWSYEVKSGTFIWSPPPAAAGVAIEELRKARIKRTDSTHIFLCPRLLTTEWLKQLHKASDHILTILPNCSIWPATMHEPLICGLILPYSQHRPWTIRETPKVVKLVGSLRKVLKEGKDLGGNLLRELLLLAQRVPSMSEDVVRRVLFFGRKVSVSHPWDGNRTWQQSRRRTGSESNGPSTGLAGRKRKEGRSEEISRSKKRR
jgi:hypothetical protein